MTCNEVQMQISLYIDDALESNQQPSMFSHLAKCLKCRTFLQHWMKTRGVMLRMPVPEVPLALDKRVKKIRLIRH